MAIPQGRLSGILAPAPVDAGGGMHPSRPLPTTQVMAYGAERYVRDLVPEAWSEHVAETAFQAAVAWKVTHAMVPLIREAL